MKVITVPQHAAEINALLAQARQEDLLLRSADGRLVMGIDRPLGRLRQRLAKPQRCHGRVTADGNLAGTFSSVGVIVRLLPALVEILFCHVLKPAFSRLTI